jgi:tetratricopeptide (TPR) repeat protein
LRVFALCLAIALTSIPAHAAPASDGTSSATPHLERGIRLFDAGDLDRAIEELELAYSLNPGPDVCYALGQALRKKGRCDKAIGYFRRAVEQSPSEKFTQAAQFQIGRCVVENPGLAQATGTTVEPPPTTAPQTPPSQPPAVQEAPPPPRPKWWRDPVGGALTFTGLAAVIAGTAVLARAQVVAADASDSLGSYHAAGNVSTLRIAGGVVLGAGGLLVLGGIARYAIHSRRAH